MEKEMNDILFIDEELPYDTCVLNEDRFIPSLAYTEYMGHWQQEMRPNGVKKRWKRHHFTDRPLIILFSNDTDDTRKKLERELGREEFIYLLERVKAGDSIDEALKKMKIGYEVGEFY